MASSDFYLIYYWLKLDKCSKHSQPSSIPIAHKQHMRHSDYTENTLQHAILVIICEQVAEKS